MLPKSGPQVEYLSREPWGGSGKKPLERGEMPYIQWDFLRWFLSSMVEVLCNNWRVMLGMNTTEQMQKYVSHIRRKMVESE